MRNFNITLLAVALTLGVAFSLCEARPDVKLCIAVKEQAQVKGEKVYLKDIATIDGPLAARKQLGAIYLAHAPAPARHRILRGTWLRNRIRSKMLLPANTVLRVPEIVRIERRFQSIQDDDFLRLYRNYVTKQLRSHQATFRVSRFRVIGNGPVPDGNLSIELIKQADGKLMGYVSLTAVIRVDGKIERRVLLSGWIDRFEKVVTVAHRLQRHTILTRGDLRLKRMNISRLPANVIKSIEAVVGKRVRHTLKADTPLLANVVEELPVIEKGDRVTIVAESPTLLVTTPGIAQGGGSAGDQIRVKNCMSNKEILGRIVCASIVKVEF